MNNDTNHDPGALARLLLNDEGFAFDPRTGESFTLNAFGRLVVRSLAAGESPEGIVAGLAQRFAVDPREVRGDVRDFMEQLRGLRLMEAVS